MKGAARWPLAVVCLYAALVPFQPVFVLPDGSPLRLAAADAVAPLVLLAAFWHPRRRLPFGPMALLLALPGLAVVATIWAAIGRSLSLYAVGKTAGLLYLAVMALAILRATDRDAAPAILGALARGTFWSAVIGLAGFAAFLHGFRTPLVEGDRLCATMTGDPNIYGGLVAVALVITATDGRARPRARLARAAILVAALLATGSRSAVLGAIAAFVVCSAVRTRDPFVSGARWAYLGAAAALAFMAVISTDLGAASAERVWEHHWRNFTVDSRLDLYARAFAEFSEHPITGLGIGGFRDLNSFEHGGHASHFVVHNTYLWALVDLGVAGGALVVGLVLAALWRCVRAARGRPAAASAAVVAAGLAAMAIFNLFIDGFYQRHFWILLACAFGLPVFRPARRPATAVWRGEAAYGVS
ncbi:MAG TPA: O-antigen ligase family protein [Candidatus Binatia bacterium]|nr:O-antigen ligase family protein [Candidatus Binatia bacterium]